MGVKVKKYRGAWWIFVHHPSRRWKCRVGASKRAADEAARQIEARLILGELGAEPRESRSVEFSHFAEQWLSSEVDSGEGQNATRLRPGTVSRYRIQVRVHLAPYFGKYDLKQIDPSRIQKFYEHCLRARRPQSAKALDMALTVLGLILAHARKLGLVEFNAATEWRSGRRRGTGATRIASENVLSAEELQHLLNVAALHEPVHFPFILFLADTGCRIGEGVALQCRDLHLDQRVARIRRSLSSGVNLGPTKAGRERVVELSSRVMEVLAPRVSADLTSDELLFPNSRGGYIHASPFRARIWKPLIAKAFGPERKFTPHGLRHTWASLHMARGTPLKWIQAQGGWTTATLLLDVYGHFLPTEYTGYADALSQPHNAPYAHPAPLVPAGAGDDSAASATRGTGFRLPVVGDHSQVPDHAQQHRPEPEASGDTSGKPEPGPTLCTDNKKHTKKRGVRMAGRKRR
jgi:integrase